MGSQVTLGVGVEKMAAAGGLFRTFIVNLLFGAAVSINFDLMSFTVAEQTQTGTL
jgi:hypothetical protein